MEKQLQRHLDAFRAAPGPFVIVAKGHSGTRFLAEAQLENGIFMGSRLNAMFDCLSWHEHFGEPLILSDYFPDWEQSSADSSFSRFCNRCLLKTLSEYAKLYKGGAWGWKGSTLFQMPIIKKYFPAAKFVHLVRDGRDATLSEDATLNLPFRYRILMRNPLKTLQRIGRILPNRRKLNKYRLRVVFGSSDISEWNGFKINKKNVIENRYLIQMQSWVHHVQTAREYGRQMPGSYLEVRYEDLCRDPAATVRSVLEFYALPVSPRTEEFVERGARVTSIGKWGKIRLEGWDAQDFENAIALAHPLLEELGYVDPGSRTGGPRPADR